MCSGRERPDQECLVAVHAEHDDADVGIAFHDLRSCIDPVELRHSNVHHDHIGAELLGHADGFTSIGRLPDNFDVGIGLQEKPETLADDTMIVG